MLLLYLSRLIQIHKTYVCSEITKNTGTTCYITGQLKQPCKLKRKAAQCDLTADHWSCEVSNQKGKLRCTAPPQKYSGDTHITF